MEPLYLTPSIKSQQPSWRRKRKYYKSQVVQRSPADQYSMDVTGLCTHKLKVAVTVSTRHVKEQESWPCLSSAAALCRVSQTPCLELELALVMQVWENRTGFTPFCLLHMVSQLDSVGEITLFLRTRGDGGLTNPANFYTPNKVYQLTHPIIKPIFDLLDHVKLSALHTQS